MKLSRLFMLALIPAMLFVFSTGVAFAQQGGGIAPNQQFGLFAGTSGFGAQYAISPSIQLGGRLAFLTGDTPTFFEIAPFVNFLLEGDVNPFFQAGIEISSIEIETAGGSATTSTTTLYVGAGLKYYITQNAGVFAGATILNLGLDPSSTIFGFSPSGVAGVEWFFD